jgi:hypothetical protein
MEGFSSICAKPLKTSWEILRKGAWQDINLAPAVWAAQQTETIHIPERVACHGDPLAAAFADQVAPMGETGVITVISACANSRRKPPAAGSRIWRRSTFFVHGRSWELRFSAGMNIAGKVGLMKKKRDSHLDGVCRIKKPARCVMAHGTIQLLPPLSIAFAELAILLPGRYNLVLLPE